MTALKWTGVRALAYRHARANGASKAASNAFSLFYDGAVVNNRHRMVVITLAAVWGEWSYNRRSAR